ncbi:MAG: ComEA family DNA-binding protein [Chloroflexi bacterium]|nr:ComEA family DNA-binding protein [Chloroflexota bacterium]
METLHRYRGYIILTLLFGAVFGGYVLYDRRPQPEPIEIIEPTLAPTPTESPLRVHVAGAVANPGVYVLAPGSRLVDAVEAAGGATADADAERVNLADRLRDGQQVYVPRVNSPVPPNPTPAIAPASEGRADGARGGLININTASAAELDTLPGIGPAYAERIIAYREAHGPFASPDEIMKVQGIGPATYDRIKGQITVE